MERFLALLPSAESSISESPNSYRAENLARPTSTPAPRTSPQEQTRASRVTRWKSPGHEDRGLEIANSRGERHTGIARLGTLPDVEQLRLDGEGAGDADLRQSAECEAGAIRQIGISNIRPGYRRAAGAPQDTKGGAPDAGLGHGGGSGTPSDACQPERAKTEAHGTSLQ